MEETLGERIKKYRKRAGLTQDELAQATELSKMSIRRYENNERVPSVNTVSLIAFALKIPITAIIGQDKDKWPDYHSRYFTPEQFVNFSDRDHIMRMCEELNDKGIDKAMEQVRLLTKIPEYRKDNE